MTINDEISTLLHHISRIGEVRCAQNSHLGDEVARWSVGLFSRMADERENELHTSLTEAFANLEESDPDSANSLLGEIQAVNASIDRLYRPVPQAAREQNEATPQNPRNEGRQHKKCLSMTDIVMGSVMDLLNLSAKGKAAVTLIREGIDILRT